MHTYQLLYHNILPSYLQVVNLICAVNLLHYKPMHDGRVFGINSNFPCLTGEHPTSLPSLSIRLKARYVDLGNRKCLPAFPHMFLSLSILVLLENTRHSLIHFFTTSRPHYGTLTRAKPSSPYHVRWRRNPCHTRASRC